jgi:hypothetical protein
MSKFAKCADMHMHAVLLVLVLAVSTDEAALEPLYVGGSGGRDREQSR